jgi:hypothetical protein
MHRMLYEGNAAWAPVFNDAGGRASTSALVRVCYTTHLHQFLTQGG